MPFYRFLAQHGLARSPHHAAKLVESGTVKIGNKKAKADQGQKISIKKGDVISITLQVSAPEDL